MRRSQKDSRDEVLDLTELLTRVENDRELLRDLLMVSKEELPKNARALREAVQSGEANRVVSIAHVLKGMLANLSANRAAGVAARLEQMGRSGQRAGFEQELARFEGEVERLMREMDTMPGVNG